MTELNVATNIFEEATTAAFEQIDAKRIEIEDTKASLFELETGDLPLDDVSERVGAWVDSKKEAFAGDHLLADLIRADRNPADCSLFRFDTQEGPHRSVADISGLVCYLADDALVNLLIERAKELGLPDGPAAAERPALIKQLSAKIAQLEAEEESLICQAHAAGIKVARHPDASPAAILEWHD